jgi:hypothetical protein
MGVAIFGKPCERGVDEPVSNGSPHAVWVREIGQSRPNDCNCVRNAAHRSIGYLPTAGLMLRIQTATFALLTIFSPAEQREWNSFERH